LKNLLRPLLKRERLVNLGLRGLTVLAKFLLSILIVKSLGVADLGVYGIFQTTLTLLVFALGFDFYTYNTREIPRGEQSTGFYLGNQGVFHLIVYLLILPISLLIFDFNVIDPQFLVYFYAILIFEHISQETYRALIVFKRSEISSMVLFLRSGIWIYALLLYWREGGDKSIESIFQFWLWASLLSVVVGIGFLPLRKPFSINLAWIKKGFLVAFPFFLGTIFYKAMEYSGRYFLDYFWSKSEVGVFTFFTGISNIVFIILHATVIIVMSPHIIEAALKGESEFNKVFEAYRSQIINGVILWTIILIAGIYPLLWYLDKPELIGELSSFFILLSATIFFCLSYIPHYGLYARRKDRAILITAFLGAIVNIGFNYLLVPKFGVTGAAISQSSGMLALMLGKGFLYSKSEDGKKQD
jgi:O-antigen/teichoic acid export membrane protein